MLGDIILHTVSRYVNKISHIKQNNSNGDGEIFILETSLKNLLNVTKTVPE